MSSGSHTPTPAFSLFEGTIKDFLPTMKTKGSSNSAPAIADNLVRELDVMAMQILLLKVDSTRSAGQRIEGLLQYMAITARESTSYMH